MPRRGSIFNFCPSPASVRVITHTVPLCWISVSYGGGIRPDGTFTGWDEPYPMRGRDIQISYSTACPDEVVSARCS